MSVTGSFTNSANIRKFAISADPAEVVDFTEPLHWFDEVFATLGFEKMSTYRFRYRDEECSLSATLEPGGDGHEVWMVVQAPDEHAFRIEAVAQALTGHIIAASNTTAYSRPKNGLHSK